MNDSEQKVTGLKKITLSFEAGTTNDRMDLTSGPQRHELVAGIGTGGFTPFEYLLLDKQVGDIIRLEVHPRQMEETFGHIDIPLPASAMALDSFFLNVTVDQIDALDQSELVRAMAGAVKGCGGDCCGHH
ncbi:MAG: hypothetical protein R6X27_16945 [Candidatus Desulfacyla sp.]